MIDNVIDNDAYDVDLDDDIRSDDFILRFFSNRFEVLFGPSYDAIVVHTFKNKVQSNI